MKPNERLKEIEERKIEDSLNVAQIEAKDHPLDVIDYAKKALAYFPEDGEK